MPSVSRALTRATRDRARHTGETYGKARAAVLAEREHTSAPEFATVQVTAFRERLTLILTPAASDAGEFIGWGRAIPLTSPGDLGPVDEDIADRLLAEARWARREDWPTAPLTNGATVQLQRQESVQAARAVREAHFDYSYPDYPCRCSTYRLTGKPCDQGKPPIRHDEVWCEGLLVHLDRYPGSVFTIDVWNDVYACDSCDAEHTSRITIPELPYGEQARIRNSQGEPITSTRFYKGARHPVDDDDFWEYACTECGAGNGYQCNCGDDRCIECGAIDLYECGCT